MNTFVHNLKLTIICKLMVGIAAGFPLVAQAGEPVRVPRMDGSFVVNYSDLDLTDPAGARTLYTRLEMAARRVCRKQIRSLEQSSSVAYQDCYNRALSKAVNRVNSRLLFALHTEHGRKKTLG